MVPLIRSLADTRRQNTDGSPARSRAVRVLNEMRDCLTSGDDSGLVSVWEEICVQVQFEESFYWDAYDYTVYDIVWREVKGLPSFVLRALWLDTIPGGDWLIEEDGEPPDPAPYCIDEVAEHITSIVYDMAADWSNRHIRAYFKRHEV